MVMLTELEKTRQIPGEGTRRWFRDEELDLIVWYKDDGSLQGFQLCYDKLRHERALTWRKPGSYQHHAIDAGEPGTGGAKMSPVLVADGVVNSAGIEKAFSERSSGVPPDLATQISDIILRYPG
jgi:hypothetical protein